MNVVSSVCSIVPGLILIHCQLDSHETPFIQCFCLYRSPFTSFPAIVLTSAGQQSEVCINGQPITRTTHASAHCCAGDCLKLNCSVGFALSIFNCSTKHLRPQFLRNTKLIKLSKLCLHVTIFGVYAVKNDCVPFSFFLPFALPTPQQNIFLITLIWLLITLHKALKTEENSRDKLWRKLCHLCRWIEATGEGWFLLKL